MVLKSLPLRRVPRSRYHTSHASASQEFERWARWFIQDELGNEIGTNLTDSAEFAYLLPISIGEQKFMFSLDTGSADVWVVSSNCFAPDCAHVPKYNTTTNTTLSSRKFELKYLSGSSSGEIAFDTVSVGQFEIAKQVFGLANFTHNLGLNTTGNSGILGLSFPLTASIPDTIGITPLENIWPHLNEPARYYTYLLGRGTSDGLFSLGELEPDYANSTSDLNLHRVFSNDNATYDYWKLPLRSITVNSQPIPFTLSPSRIHTSSTPVAVLDTGTTLMLGPGRDVELFWQTVGNAQLSPQTGLWQVRCDHAALVGLTLGDASSSVNYVIDPADMSWAGDGAADGWCLGGLQKNNRIHSGDWLLGDTFLRNVYVAHFAQISSQPPRIGLLNVTDPEAALADFRSSRGIPPLNSTTTGSGAAITDTDVHPRKHGLSTTDIVVISTLGGCVLGCICFAIAYIPFRKKWLTKPQTPKAKDIQEGN